MKMPGNMQAMMQQAQKMQQKMQEEIAQIRVEASAGGGMVSVKMDGHKNVTGVKIDSEVLHRQALIGPRHRERRDAQRTLRGQGVRHGRARCERKSRSTHLERRGG